MCFFVQNILIKKKTIINCPHNLNYNTTIPLVINKADNGTDAVFLLRTGESLDIKIDSFNARLKPLLTRHKG